MAVIFKHISDPLPRPRKIIPDIPDKVERVVFKALAKKPEDRYADMTAFSTAIEKLVQVNSVPSWDQKHRLDSIVKSTVGESLPETRDDLQSFIPAPATQNQKNTKRPLTNQIKKNLPKPINEKSKVVSYGLAIIFVILFGISIFLNKSNLSQIKKMGLFIRTENSMDPNATLKLTSDGQNPIAVIQSTNTSMKPTETSDELKQINTLEMTITSSVAPLITETIAPTISPTVDLEYLASLRIGSKKISEIDGMSQVFVPAGTFIMGSNDYLDKRHYRAAESPEHEVYLDAFWIDKTELTNGKYRLCVDAGVCEPPRRLESNTREDYFLNPAYDEYPVISVEWSQAQTYCQWAGRTLPTEAEWEKAARGVSGSMRPFGKYDGNINYLSWYGDTTFVGKFLNELSPYGVLDMRGNVSEWVYDWYDPDYYKGKLSFQKWENPKGPDEPTLGHVIRGGSYSSEYERVQVTSRDSLYLHQNNNGFRCVEPVVFPKMLETEYQK
jgi:formylglycine-generating enzyme required for sulfatase activity